MIFRSLAVQSSSSASSDWLVRLSEGLKKQIYSDFNKEFNLTRIASSGLGTHDSYHQLEVMLWYTLMQ
jgi:hypothetical protein